MAKKKTPSEQQILNKFQTITDQTNPKPKIVRNCARAFLVGGAICTLGQIFQTLLVKYGFQEEEVKMLLPIIMVFLGALLTGVGIYDKIASFGGAGTVVPITGFSNAVVAPAIEFKKEGFVFGVAAKMFTIAGPVLVYGIGSSVIIGIIYYLIQLLR
ncbi:MULTISPECIES: stage V sporulation protein AC [Clostridium]|jgi:stage V sporulation protein AC|uniref:Stage V sporulation protein AC n=1 Tax=Clostridium tertium TaxID=1559 RepID=A0A9X3XML6_9CLOT|nr:MULTISPECIES: stage V sporulation protein AC [Clostridium]EEH98845.1 stage V sporulation protein AC [Clostridium sp. 7_2_43FAA]MBP1869533.1 stage V sporulation protein AC [Clostridium tertium]MBS5305832.1 stage V sporulation protein AC [Clostridium sp.]MBS5885972.1 stage V sporulation protein AC [Clostridium sp.]MBS6503764.1 stage V sporulation protein AC [Clostridium sp.]